MNIKEMSLDSIKEYENNPRNNDGAVEAVAESIKQFGFKVPIIIDKNNVIVAGHTRAKAAAVLGLDKVPCIIADDLTEQQAQAFRLADNKVGELAGWDFEKLNQELEELDISGFDMEQFGFKQQLQEDISIDLDENTKDSKSNSQSTTYCCPKCGFEFEVK